MAMLAAGGMPWMWRHSGAALSSLGGLLSLDLRPETHPISHALVFFLGVTAFGFVTELPWSYARAFWLEERHGFNNQVRGVDSGAAAQRAGVAWCGGVWRGVAALAV